MSHRIILDVDTGTDDAIALMVAALSPDIELVGATTVNGNVHVPVCTENTLRVFDHIGVKDSIPVYEGMAIPMVRPNFVRESPSLIHGEYFDLPPAQTAKQQQHAVDWLIETYMQSDGDITLVPVGPLTNIGMAIQKEPRILPKIPELVIMGGGHEVGNMSPSAEFNIWVDPEAAKLVLNCGRPIRLVPLDATHRALVSTEDVEQLRALGTPAGDIAAMFISTRISGYDMTQPMSRLGAAPVHDALCVCAIIDPTIITTKFINVDVETKGELTDGRTVCDVYHRSKSEPNMHVAFDADAPKFVRMLLEILGRRR
ncbi:MAG: nucleoside hydrolase [Herpetosiphonaceae bacterium]|nr:nucleoside hydrolase [Herpetosiphonaceae bacterium]